MKKQMQATHVIFGGFALLFGVLMIGVLVVLRSQASTSSTLLSVNNEAPTVDTVKICSGSGDPGGCSHIPTATGLTLTSGTTTGFSIAGTLSDANGFSDITSFFGEFRKDDTASFAGSPCDPDTDECYTESLAGLGCTLTSTSATAGTFECPISIEYYAIATSADAVLSEQGEPSRHWVVRGYAVDSSGQNGFLENTTEVNTLRALETDEGDACTTINYGSLANGAATADSSSPGTDCVLENAGNVDTDVTEQAGHMTCTFGGIATTNQRVNVTSGTYAQMATGGINLSSSATSIDLALNKRNSATGIKVLDNLYHAISVPATGASGTCSGTNTIVAVSEI